MHTHDDGKAPTIEKIAAHESGHAIVFASVGIPVTGIHIKKERVSVDGRVFTRFGWTMTNVDSWSESSGLTRTSVFVRRMLGNAGGIVGELLAGLHDVTSDVSVRSDLEQIAGCLLALGVLQPQETESGSLRKIVGVEAARLLLVNKIAFDQLRTELVANKSKIWPCPPIEVFRTVEEDVSLLHRLQVEQESKRHNR